MIEVVAEVCQAFALTISEKKKQTMCLPPPRTPRTMMRVDAAGPIDKQVQLFPYLGGTITKPPDMSTENAMRTRACWMFIRRQLRKLYDQPKVALSLKIRIVKAKAIDTLMYGCSTWTLRQEHYHPQLRTVHHRILLCIIGARRKRLDRRMTFYNSALEITGYEIIETTLQTRRVVWAATLIQMSGGRLPKRIRVQKP